ncbi:MAG: ABC transporter permease subunit [Chloroflexi bacterium]|nr:ABC transporter permease subunit [Chloroflexota bacterium]
MQVAFVGETARSLPLVLRRGLQAAFVVGVILTWEMLFRLELLDPLFVAPPGNVLRAAYEHLVGKELWRHFWITMSEIGAAYVIAAVSGVGLGLVVGVRRYLRTVLDPFVVNFYAIPKITLFPLFVLWFGVGLNSKIAFGAIHGFFPLFILTVAGVRDVRASVLATARAFGAEGPNLYLKVLLPSITPSVLSGARLALIYTVVGVLLAEMAVSSAGLGKLLTQYASSFLPANLYAVALITASFTVIANQLLYALERRANRWRT